MNLPENALTDLNLNFLHGVREALLRNRATALGEFQIDGRVADLLLAMTQDQLRRLANARVLLFGLRWRRHAVWSCLGEYAAGTAAALPQALLVAEAESADGYQA
ncbi:MAG: flagellar transcriptional regulator FlhD [Pseudomonadota bacterium]|nr:flagellar transcriptional regulator FlhD [Pseudomonadota bacterium]